MDVLIRLERSDPPAGTVVRPQATLEACTGAPLPFVGWLGLLRLLAEVVRAATEPGEAE